MNYFIYISISKSSVSFGYWQKGSTKPLTPFPWSEWPVPLSFYCSPNGIVIGEEAERAAANKWTGAYRDWFSQLSSGESFEYMAKSYPIRYLFLLAAEEQFRKFFNQVLYESEGALESMRGSLPLLLSFDDNVPENQRILVANLFRDGGYGKVLDVSGNAYVASYYGKRYPGKAVLVMDSDGNDLFLSLYNPATMQLIDKKVVEGFGADPRIEQLCDILWQKTEGESYWLNKNQEYEKLKLEAAKVLESGDSEIEGDIEYSNGNRLSYFITRNEINNIRVGSNMGLPNVVGQFLGKNSNLIGMNPPVLVLRNYAVSNRYFYNSLKNQFSDIILVTEDERDNYGQLLVEETSRLFNSMPPNLGVNTRNIGSGLDNTATTPKPEPQGFTTNTQPQNQAFQQAPASGFSTGNPSGFQTGGFTQTGNPFQGNNQTVSQPQQPEPPTPEAAEHELTSEEKRQIRQLLVESKMEAKKGNKDKSDSLLQEAKALIGDAIDQLPKSTADLLNEVGGLLDIITENVGKVLKGGFDRLKSMAQQATERATGSSRPAPSPTQSPRQTPPPVETPSQARTILERKDYIKAKDAYRAEGDEKMASLCIDLNKAQRQFKVWEMQYDGCVKNRNVANAKKAITEINHYIDLLQQAGLNFDNEKLLQNKYKTIK